MYDHAAMLSIVTCGALAGCSAGTPASQHARPRRTPAHEFTMETASRAISKTHAAFRECIRAWSDRQWCWEIRRALALWVIKGRRPSSMPAGRYPTTMTQFGWMNARDAAALFTYLRSSHRQ